MSLIRISAALAILVGLLLGYKTADGMAHTHDYFSLSDHSYVYKHFALQWMFVIMSLGGGVLAMWRSWFSLLAASWGVVFALTVPHLIRPSISPEMLRMMASHGGNAYVVGVDPGEVVLAAVAVIGLALCGVSEFYRARSVN